MSGMRGLLASTFLLTLAIAGCVDDAPGPDFGAPKDLQVRSSAFAEGQAVPVRHTCDGDNVSPPLSVRGVPDGAARLALIMDDPDAGSGTWTHWTFWNLPVGHLGLAQGTNVTTLGAVEGEGSGGAVGYRGPCPPPGTGEHRYRFKVYALDAPLDLERATARADLEAALDGHVVAWGELMGVYARATSGA